MGCRQKESHCTLPFAQKVASKDATKNVGSSDQPAQESLVLSIILSQNCAWISDLHLKYFRMNAEQMDELLFSVVGPELTRQIFEQPSNPNSDLQLH